MTDAISFLWRIWLIFSLSLEVLVCVLPWHFVQGHVFGEVDAVPITTDKAEACVGGGG